MDNIMCDNCTHAKVCRYQAKLYSITKKLETFEPFDENHTRLAQVDWIDCTPSCKHYDPFKRQVFRDGENAL